MSKDVASERVATVTVVYALPQEQYLTDVPWRAGLTAMQAYELSGLGEQFPEIASRELILGVFGRRVAADYRLAAGDRVEVCRVLQRDPRELRRFLTAEGLVVGQRARDAEQDG